MWVTLRDDGSTVKLNTDHIALLNKDEKSVMLSSGYEINLTDDDYDELEKTIFPTRKVVAKGDSDLAAFLNELHRLTGGKGPALLSPKRKKALQDILKIEDMTREKLLAAATNIGRDPFLQGDNDKNKRWGDVDYLLRADKAVKWAEYKPGQRKMF